LSEENKFPALTQEEIQEGNLWVNFFQFQETDLWNEYIRCPAKICAFFTGNQYGKDAGIARAYVLQILGFHPVAERNFDYLTCNGEDPFCEDPPAHRFSLRYRTIPHPKHGLIGKECPVCQKPLVLYCSPWRTWRCASENLPGQADDEKGVQSEETRNTQYPEFKKWLPPHLIVKDITARNPVIKIRDPNGGQNILFEFVSYNQSTQGQAGVQRAGVWFSEQPPLSFYNEQKPRLLASGGYMDIGLTPALYMSYMYDEIFCRARMYYRSKTIQEKFHLPEREFTGLSTSIAVFQAATDDNPTLKRKHIEEIFREIDDPDELAIRRYGQFKQVSGTIHKGFDYRVHVIGVKKYFPNGIPHDWIHARMIDYHPRVRWAFNAVALSPDDELFVYLEYDPDPTKLITYEIAREIAKLCGDYKYLFDKIDPLANDRQGNTGKTTIEDLNKAFREFRLYHNLGTGANWTPWNSKGNVGREEVQKRIHNSRRVGRPFNNRVMETGPDKRTREVCLPTLWVLDCCPQTAKSLKMWRWMEGNASESKEAKETPEQRWSHHNMCLEAILKEKGFRPMFNRSVVDRSLFARDEERRMQRRYFSIGAR